jgi:hypothetical protein
MMVKDYLFSDSIPYKCLAIIEFKKGSIEHTPKKIASSNQFDDSRIRVESNASPMIPNKAKIKPRIIIKPAAILHFPI